MWGHRHPRHHEWTDGRTGEPPSTLTRLCIPADRYFQQPKLNLSSNTLLPPTLCALKMPPHTLVVDNGAYTIKAGFVTKNPSYNDCYLIPNCIARSRDRRPLVGTQLESCRDFGGMAFRRPVEKVMDALPSGGPATDTPQGYLVNWEAQKEIWDRTFLDADSPLHVLNPAPPVAVQFSVKTVRSP